VQRCDNCRRVVAVDDHSWQAETTELVREWPQVRHFVRRAETLEVVEIDQEDEIWKAGGAGRISTPPSTTLIGRRLAHNQKRSNTESA
jgi:hypothetical protein